MRQHPLVGDIAAGLLKFVAFVVVGAIGLGIGLFSFLQVIGFTCPGGMGEPCTTTGSSARWILGWAILGVVTVAVIATWYAIYRMGHRRGDVWLGAALAAVPVASIAVDDLLSPTGVAVWILSFVVVGTALRLARERRSEPPRGVSAGESGTGSGGFPMVGAR